ncbi:MAG: metallophosphoesterase [Nocardioides sp.]|nr:metallophosphoesterase [Nocardioides sp.]
MSDDALHRVLRHTTRIAPHVAVWLLLSVLAAVAVFLAGSRTIVLASHDAVLHPTFSGYVVLHTGPVLPDVRRSSGGPVGVDIRLGKTEAASTDELVQRYAFLAGHPEGQVAKVRDALTDMALDAAVRGAALGLLPLGVWLLMGPGRRRELAGRVRSREGAAAGVAVLLLAAALWEPWTSGEDTVEAAHPWTSLADFLGPDVPISPEAAGIEVRGDVTTQQTHRLITSAVAKYESSKSWYADATVAAADLVLHQPAAGDTVVTFISDRHDNIGMDDVARAIGDAAGASVVFDGGDDTSSGKTWEAFSLDSVSAAFDGLDRYGVGGNHDHGSFVHSYLADHGWTMMDGTVQDGPVGTTILGVDDPRSSGLGAWRDETGLSFDDVAQRLSDVACDSDTRVTTMLVHDQDLATDALRRGCVDLVLAGHLHVQEGPTRVVGTNGKVGYTYTTGTAGGAAYAIAIGGKIRRDAEITLVTYRDGRPVGIQPVTLQTTGVFLVGRYLPLDLAEGSAQK